jgi:hypothetical protein
MTGLIVENVHTQRPGGTILVVDRADADHLRPGRLWTQD